jgi:Leucine-rich repeat (LRR) protein
MIEDLPDEFIALPQLLFLDLSENNLQSLPLSIYVVKQLERLHLSSNHIGNLSVLVENFTKLRSLHISSNQLRFLPAELFTLRSLEQLDLADNRITSISNEINYLTKLTMLWLNSNMLSEIPKIHKLERLVEFSAFGNPLRNPPPIDEIENVDQMSSINQFHSLIAQVQHWQTKLELIEQLPLPIAEEIAEHFQ